MKIETNTSTNDLKQSVTAFEKWAAMPVGVAILEAQQAILDEYLQTVFGYYLLQLSISRKAKLYDASSIKHKFAMHPMAADSVSALYEDALPLETESIDVVILHHLLSYSVNPHQLLKEINRIILPSGHLIIVGFNPFSLMGFKSLINGVFQVKSRQKHIFSVSRLSDWLKLIDFTVQKVDYGFYRPPYKFCLNSGISLNIEKKLKRLQWPFGAFYIVQAKKQIMPISPIKLKRVKTRPQIIPVMKPSLNASKAVEKNND